MLLEVCVDSLASARAAIAGGADRLELCSALLAGGLTPYTELLRQIRHESDVAVRCLIRPRAGDFLYMPEEIEMMCAQITELRSAGANGFVIGCLNPDGTLDCTATARLAKAANGAGLTLHRAIDVSADPFQTYRDAAALGIDTVLTSGAAASCVQGVDVLCSLLAERDRTNGPEVLIGVGRFGVILLYFLFFFLIFAISFAVFSFSCLTFCRAYGNITIAPWWWPLWRGVRVV